MVNAQINILNALNSGNIDNLDIDNMADKIVLSNTQIKRFGKDFRLMSNIILQG